MIWPVRTDGVFVKFSSGKYQRLEAIEAADEPGTMVDDITPKDAIDCTGSTDVFLCLESVKSQKLSILAVKTVFLGFEILKITPLMFVRWKSYFLSL